jgi:hypothetical protein
MTSTGHGLACALLALGALLPAARGNDVPATFPRFDLRSAATAIVVARVTAGAELPVLEECTKKDVICLHDPFWFHAEVRETLLGAPLATDTNVSTLSHYGLESFLRGSPWRLLSLKSVGAQVVMPINASDILSERSDGELFLVDEDGSWPSWLPCSVPDLLEPLGDASFTPDPAERRDDTTGKFPYWVTEHPEGWRIEGDRAFPRAGVRVTRLRTLLRDLAVRHETTNCPRAN